MQEEAAFLSSSASQGERKSLSSGEEETLEILPHIRRRRRGIVLIRDVCPCSYLSWADNRECKKRRLGKKSSWDIPSREFPSLVPRFPRMNEERYTKTGQGNMTTGCDPEDTVGECGSRAAAARAATTPPRPDCIIETLYTHFVCLTL